jgi:hypothetical protein
MSVKAKGDPSRSPSLVSQESVVAGSQMKSPQSRNFSCLTTPRSSHRLSTPPTAAQCGCSARGAKRRAPLARPILQTAGRAVGWSHAPATSLLRGRSSEPPDDPRQIQGEGIIWRAAVTAKSTTRSAPQCLRKKPRVVKRDVSK